MIKKKNVWYQGDDIPIKIKYRNPDGNYEDLDNFTHIYIYLWTDKTNISTPPVIQKFVYVTASPSTPVTGHILMTKLDEFTRELIVPSSVTSSIKTGVISIEMNFVTATNLNEIVVDYSYGTILPSTIKAASL